MLLLIVAVIVGVSFMKLDTTGFAIFQMNDQNSFDQGNYTQTVYDGSGFVQLDTGQTSGSYTSNVFDATVSISANNFTTLHNHTSI
jgi:hypothetical protein